MGRPATGIGTLIQLRLQQVTSETENLVLTMLRDIRKEQTEQRTLLLNTVDYMRKMEQPLDGRIVAIRDDIELMLKSELLGRLTHFETTIDGRIEALANQIAATDMRASR